MSDSFKNLNLNEKKRLDVALFEIYGIGKFESKKLYSKLGFNSNMRISDLDSEGEELLLTFLKKDYLLGNSLKLKMQGDIIRKGELESYQGIRHKNGLPVRGQRTKNNIATAKKLNTTILPRLDILSRMGSKDRRREVRKEKRLKKQEKKSKK